ncbi:hypothetical protein D3C77_504590 [compost metagenome]
MIDILQAALGILQYELAIELIVSLVGLETVTGGIADVALVLAIQANVLSISGVPRGITLQSSSAEFQPGNFLADQLAAVKHTRQESGVVVL